MLLAAQLQGAVWNDFDASGVREPGETGLAGWTVFLDDNKNGLLDQQTELFHASDVPRPILDLDTTTSELVVVGVDGRLTDVDVRLSIDHTYVSDLTGILISPTGTRVELMSSVGGSGDDFVQTTFDDESSVSIVTAAAPFTSSFRPEEALARLDGENPNGIWKLEITDNSSIDTGDLLSWSLSLTTTSEPAVLTDDDGTFVFAGVSAGDYRVMTELPDGRQQSFPSDARAHLINAAAEEIVEGIDFGNQYSLAELAGQVWSDIDGDGQRISSEPALAGWTVYLDSNGNQQLDDSLFDVTSTGDAQPITDFSTAVSEIFVEGTPGVVTDVDVSLNIHHTFDGDLSVVLISPVGHRVELFSDVGASGNNFLGTRLDDEAPTSITEGIAPFSGSFRPEGRLSDFEGVSANGAWRLEITDSEREDDGTLLDWTLHLSVGEPRRTTDANGEFRFTELLPASYDIRVEQRAGWTSTFPAGGAVQTVDLGRGAVVSGILFGRRAIPGEIHGVKWSDHNGNGRRDQNERLLADWTTFLDANNNGQLDIGERSTVTDTVGAYSFTGLQPGVYRVAEVMQQDWQQTYPGAGTTQPVSEFAIELVLPNGSLTGSQEAILIQAAERWSEVIVGDLPDVGQIDDLQVVVKLSEMDGSGGVLGRAGPTATRVGTQLPYRGFLELDASDIAQLEADGRLLIVALHELAHVLGFGTIWDRLDLISGSGTSNPRFIGAQAVAQYNAVFGVDESSVPLESSGGSGTLESHWSEEVFGAELMTGFVKDEPAPLSRMTVASLADLGYEVDLDAADAYAPVQSANDGAARVVRDVLLDLTGDAVVSSRQATSENRGSLGAAIRRASDLDRYSKAQLASVSQWVVNSHDGLDRDRLAALLGVSPNVLQPAGTLIDAWIVETRTASQEVALESLFADKSLTWYPLVSQTRVRRGVPNDEFFSEQWNLRNTGQTGGTVNADINVAPAWDSVLGRGVQIAIVDDGVDASHPEFVSRYREDLSYDFNDNDTSATPASDASHGTAVAGLAGASGNNHIGISGVAPAAEIASLRLIAKPTIDATEAAALAHEIQSLDIYNNSWGPTDDAKRLDGPGPLTLAAIENGIENGRGGLGSIYVWSAGNGAGSNDNVNYDGYANSRYTIAVSAIDHDGEQSSYSEPGAPILVAAYSSGDGVRITTTDPAGSAGQPGDYNSGFGGTSAAAPLVSGAVALMLEANPNLTWRDVQHILVRTARRNDATDHDWTWNGAGRAVNHKYGFGAVDAAAAVNVAAGWTGAGAEHAITSGVINAGLLVPDDSPTGVSSTVTITEAIDIEWVEVVFDAEHSFRGNLEVVLTAPSGTESILAQVHGDSGDDYRSWVFTSARHWDERSLGEWTLTVRDLVEGDTGNFDGWQLNLYGTIGDAGYTVTVEPGQAVTGIDFGNRHLGDQTAPVVAVDPMLTRDATPRLSGTVDDADAILNVTVVGNIYPAINHGDGTWTVPDDLLAPLPDGVYDLIVTAIDLAGNIGADNSNDELEIDTTAPSVTIDALSTNNSTPLLSGSIDDERSVITVMLAGQSFRAPHESQGRWSLDLDGLLALADGVFDVEVRAVDPAGNEERDGSVDELRIDTIPPAVSFQPLVTNVNAPTLSGTVDDPTAVVFLVIEGAGYPATNRSDGTWQLTGDVYPAEFRDGTYTVQVIATDSVGNVGQQAQVALVIDTEPPVISVGALLTNNPTPTLSGLVDDPTAVIAVTVAGVNETATNHGDGAWSLLIDFASTERLEDGRYDVSVRAEDAAGNVAAETSVELSIDTVAPTPGFTRLRTNHTAPRVFGTIDDPTAAVLVALDRQEHRAMNHRDGTWSLPSGTVKMLADGSHEVTVVARDDAGNQRSIEIAGGILMDTTPPVASLDVEFTMLANPELFGSVDDPTAQVTIEIANVVYACVNHGNGSWTLPGTELAMENGSHAVKITAADTLGNRSEAVTQLVISTTPWKNSSQPFDVNGDGIISPLDALVLINELNAAQFISDSGRLPEVTGVVDVPVYLDPDGDQHLSPTDVLIIFNYLSLNVYRA